MFVLERCAIANMAAFLNSGITLVHSFVDNSSNDNRKATK